MSVLPHVKSLLHRCQVLLLSLTQQDGNKLLFKKISSHTELTATTGVSCLLVSHEMLYAEVATEEEMISEEQQAPTWGFEKKTKGMQGGERGSGTERRDGGGRMMSMLSHSQQQQRCYIFPNFMTF